MPLPRRSTSFEQPVPPTLYAEEGKKLYVDDFVALDQPDDLDDALTYVLQHLSYLTPEQVERLTLGAERLKPPKEEEEEHKPVDIGYGAGFDLAAEVEEQIAAVRAIRRKVMSESGKLKDEVSLREAKEVVSTGSTLLNSLMKFHERVVNMARIRVLEKSVIEALEDESTEIKDRVIKSMERRLETAL